MNFKRFKAICIKESLQILRDPSSILIAFILPLILMFLMGYAVNLDTRNIPFAISNKSQSSLSKSFVTHFTNSNLFITDIGQNEKEYIDKIQNNTLKGLIVIPSDFGKNNIFNIQILTDGTEPNSAGLIQKYASAIVINWAKEHKLSTGINIKTRYWYNENVLSKNFLLPGSIAVVMNLIGTLLTALVVAREWERGTMEALMATPTSMVEITLGKLIPYFLLSIGSMLLCFVIARFWYETPFRGSFIILFILSIFYLIPTLCAGLLISIVSKNQFVAAQFSLVVSFLPVFLLSGFIFLIDNMPIWLQYLTLAIPGRYFVNSLQSIFLAGNIYEFFILDSFAMLIFGVVSIFIILKKSKKGLE